MQLEGLSRVTAATCEYGVTLYGLPVGEPPLHDGMLAGLRGPGGSLTRAPHVVCRWGLHHCSWLRSLARLPRRIRHPTGLPALAYHIRGLCRLVAE